MGQEERAADQPGGGGLTTVAEAPHVSRLDSLAELEALIEHGRHLFVRFSKGIEADRDEASVDYESGLELPGLSVNPLDPESWWTRSLHDWLARQLCNYVHLQENADDERYAWVLTGDVVGRGPDNEPLVRDAVPIALLSDRLLEEAKRRYEENFEAGKDSTGQGSRG
jgi:hypothetical protein